MYYKQTFMCTTEKTLPAAYTYFQAMVAVLIPILASSRDLLCTPIAINKPLQDPLSCLWTFDGHNSQIDVS